ncbi:MAG: UDP-N-acetylmuramoyl-L-alanyl-D-glutamate--2,6-diaminopimelate ligase [Lactobacillus sp.]|nr:UDP-N-acetylmuramoyl-L-alanyl-D-glutamate--2,6-diaminopimelate ligase [Lactobacillus sp.]MCI2031901.1 UDP-N-acetylmuramoyl-L-alanyl-D-glutamate--2,6-diaminopimelate ligase [Lactobacillus sp.]
MRISECASLLNLDQETRQRLATEKLVVTSLTPDTRQVQPGGCFVAIKGQHFDGHAHVQEAIAKGAVLVVVQQPVAASGAMIVQVPDTHQALAQLSVVFYGDPSAELKMFGVTGTNGKTTVTHLIARILAAAKRDCGVIGTLYATGGQETHAAVNTTPDSYTNQVYLHEMLAAGKKACAMEVSSIGLAQGRVRGIDFDTAVFTNLTEDHLDYHHTFEAYFEAKALLFEQLGNTYHHGRKVKSAVINIDDPYGRRLLDRTAANVLTYGIKGRGDLQARDIQVGPDGTRFFLTIAGHRYPVHLQLMGAFNVANALAAFGATYVHGLSPRLIIRALESAAGVPGRFQVVPTPVNATVIVDYAHTPDGLANVLQTITAFAKRRVFCVVGCGGDRDAEKRPQMATIAWQQATDPIFTADNPRTEDPEAIIDQMVAGLDPATYTRLSDRRQAIAYALGQAQAGDVVLIAGKGHEDYQIIGTTKHHFDDVEQVQAFYAPTAASERVEKSL